jgi:hypothetical protein
MFRITRDPSSGSFIKWLAKFTVIVLSCPLIRNYVLYFMQQCSENDSMSRNNVVTVAQL